MQSYFGTEQCNRFFILDVFSPAAYMLAKAAREQVQAAVAALDEDHHDVEMKQDGMRDTLLISVFINTAFKTFVIIVYKVHKHGIQDFCYNSL